MLIDIMPLKSLVSAGFPVAPAEWSPANRMPELARTILGIGAGRGGGQPIECQEF
jgi:hypothetical protein